MHRLGYSLWCERDCLCSVDLLKVGQKVRSRPGPEVNFGVLRGVRIVEMKKPQPRVAGAYGPNDECSVCEVAIAKRLLLSIIRNRSATPFE